MDKSVEELKQSELGNQLLSKLTKPAHKFQPEQTLSPKPGTT